MIRARIVLFCAIVTISWLMTPPFVDAAGILAIYDSLPMTGSMDVPTGLNMSAGQGITLYYNVGDFAKCKPVESSFNRLTVNLSSTTDPQQYGFFSVEANLNETSQRYFRLKDPTLSELQPQTTYQLTLKGGEQGIAISCSTILATTIYHLINDYTTSFTTGRDTVPPVISNLKSQAQATQATITWSTDQKADSQVAYGISASLGQFSSPNTQLARSQSASLTGLIPGTIYYYQVLSKDEAGNLSTATGQFSTLVIAGLQAEQPSGHEVTIRWTTNQPTDSIVEFGPTSQYIRRAGNYASTTTHQIRLTNLDPSTIYHYRVRATSAGGISYSVDQVFQTTDVVGVTTVSPPMEVDEEIVPELIASPPPQVLAATDTAENQATTATNATSSAAVVEDQSSTNLSLWAAIPVVLGGLCVGMYLLLRHQHRIGRLRQLG